MDRFIKDNTLKAVYSDDLDYFLTENGILNQFVNGMIHCKYCGDTINRANLFALIPEKEGLQFCCDRAECTEQMIREASTSEDEQ